MTLTFDDGPDPVNTPKVLDLLKSYGVTATFFVMGAKAGDVSRTHPQGDRRGASRRKPQLGPPASADVVGLRGSHAAVRHVVGDRKRGGIQSDTVPTAFRRVLTVVDKIARELGMTVIRWTTDSNDWRGNDPAQITDAVLGHLHNHAVVLAHDGFGRCRTPLRPCRK